MWYIWGKISPNIPKEHDLSIFILCSCLCVDILSDQASVVGYARLLNLFLCHYAPRPKGLRKVCMYDIDIDFLIVGKPHSCTCVQVGLYE